MRILTVKQPWAQAIIRGGKNVENRVRNIAGSYRGPVAIHAGLQRDDRGWVQFGGYRLTRTMSLGHPYAVGAIVGVVDLVDVHVSRAAFPCSDWAESGCYHLVLRNPRPVDEPIPYKGALGLRTLPDDVAQRILEAVAS